MARRTGMQTIDEYEMLDLTLRKASQDNLSQTQGKLDKANGPDENVSQFKRTALFIKHQDFVPDKRKKGGAMGSPDYEPFSSLVEKANFWLRSNPGKTLISCEMLDIPLKDPEKLEDVINSTTIIDSYDQEDSYVYHLRKLRLWYSMHPATNPQVEQLGYRFVIPSAMNISKDVHKTCYESFSCALASHNTNRKLQPLQGDIFSLQTIRCKVHSKTNMPQPEETLWRQGRMKDIYLLHVLLIFCRIKKGDDDKQADEIFYRDFIPPFSGENYASFQQVAQNINSWRTRETSISVVNIQSIDYKASDYKLQPDTDWSFFRELGDGPTHYVTILRVYYMKNKFPGNPDQSAQDCKTTCRRFFPYMTRSPDCFGRADFETNPQIRERMAAWVRATGARVISVETFPFITRSGEFYFHPEVTYRRCRNPGAFQVVQLYCVHLSDNFEEPCIDKLPPLPELKSSYCCCIS